MRYSLCAPQIWSARHTRRRGAPRPLPTRHPPGRVALQSSYYMKLPPARQPLFATVCICCGLASALCVESSEVQLAMEVLPGFTAMQVSVLKGEGIGVLHLNRAQKSNACDAAFWEEFPKVTRIKRGGPVLLVPSP